MIQVVVRRVGADDEHLVELETDDPRDCGRVLAAVERVVSALLAAQEGDGRAPRCGPVVPARSGLRVVR